MVKLCKESSGCIFDTLQLVGNKWVMIILLKLLEGTKRFGVLQKEIEQISPKVLTQQLKKLEREGLVTRTVYPEIPPRVEYSLTDKSQELAPLIERVIKWGEKYQLGS